MAKIEERSGRFRAMIRKKGVEISKTFSSRDMAELWARYKEDLIDNMDAFDVDIKDRVSVKELFELKLKTFETERSKHDTDYTFSRISEFLDVSRCMKEIGYDEWIDIAKRIYEKPVYRGAVKEKNKKKMSPVTLRKILASLSAVVSHAQSLGIALDNHPLKVIQSFINPMIKKEKV